MDEVPEKMMLDHEVKQANPWDVASIFEFNYFCCPECDCKLQLKQDFINHASFHHPWVSWRFYQSQNILRSNVLRHHFYLPKVIIQVQSGLEYSAG